MSNFTDYDTPRRPSSFRKGLESILFVLFGVILSFLIAGILGAILYFAGFAPLIFPFLGTATPPGTPPFGLATATAATPTPTSPQFPTLRPSGTPFPTFTSFVLPSWTPSAGPPTFTRTPVPTRTRTRTPVPTRTSTRTATIPPSRTFTPSNTPTQSRTPTPTNTPTQTFTPTNTFTPTLTPTPTNTPGAPVEPLCASVSVGAPTNPNPYELAMNITNSSGAAISINRVFAYWADTPQSQQLDRVFLNGVEIWNASDLDSPSDISNWISSALNIPDAATRTLLLQFQNDLQPTGYEVHIIFHTGCQVIGTK